MTKLPYVVALPSNPEQKGFRINQANLIFSANDRHCDLRCGIGFDENKRAYTVRCGQSNSLGSSGRTVPANPSGISSGHKNGIRQVEPRSLIRVTGQHPHSRENLSRPLPLFDQKAFSLDGANNKVTTRKVRHVNC